MTKKYIQEFKSKLAKGDTVSPEELQDFFSRLEGDLKDKKYGLVWESQTEQVIEQLKTNKVYLEEEHDLKITQDPDNPKSNILIEGDNYEALTYLNEINQKVDVIYIDPPYNTGNKDFIYNDRFIDKEDGFRHSQWLSFMDARLRLARELLTDDGVILISIDDNELYQLKLLCDQIFGENNFVANMIWEKRHAPKNNAKLISVRHDYILVYAKVKESIKINLVERTPEQLKGYKNPDNDPKGPWTRGNMLSPKYSEKNFYEIVTPEGKVYKPKNGTSWRYSKDKVLQMISEGRVSFEPNMLREKRYLSEAKKGVVPETMLFHKSVGHSQMGTEELKNMFHDKIFDYPKPTKLIKWLCERYAKKDSTVLDFFAGSGTTGHAVLELNQEDGGNRQYILVTNNENNIAEEVTYERLKRVMNGYTTPKGKDVTGIPSNLTYYKTKQVSKV